MFVNKDFFDDDDDDSKLDLNSSPYTNVNSNTTQKKDADYGLGQLENPVRKEFDVNGTAFYDNSNQNQINRGYNGLGTKSSVTFTKKPLTTINLSKSRAGPTSGQNFLYGRDNDVESQNSYSKNVEYGQKQQINNDLDLTDLGNIDNYSGKASLIQSNSGLQSGLSDNRPFSKDGPEGTRPGTSTGSDQRQKALIQQKQRLLDQQRLQFSGTFQSNEMLNKNQNTNSALYYKPEENKDTNYDDLSKYAYDGKKEFYDPSMKKNDKARFELNKAQQNIKYENNEDYIPPTRKDFDAAKDTNPLVSTKNQPDEESENEEEDVDAQKFAELEKKHELEKVKNQNAPKEAKVETVNQQLIKEQEQYEQQDTSDPDANLKLVTSDSLQIVDMRSFLMAPAPKNYLVQCTIKRDKSGFARFYPKYYVHLSNGYRFLMGGKKRAGNRTSNYAISMSARDFKKKSPNFLGKLRSNFLGTEFNIWDNGLNPKKNKSLDRVREQLGVVLYEANLLGSKGPRKMRALIPDIKTNGEKYQFKPMGPKEGMLTNFMGGRMEGLKLYYNKAPKWNEQYQAFVLNFNGRVEKPSVKNFQLIEESNENRIILQFGRVNNDTFNMDFQWPLSPFQAFAICLSSFDYKIACE